MLKITFLIVEEGKRIHLRDVTKAPQDVQKQYGTNATILNSTTATVIQVCFFSCLLKYPNNLFFSVAFILISNLLTIINV